MSSRVLKKLQGDDLEFQPNNEDDGQASEEEEEPDTRGKGKNKNFFDLVSETDRMCVVMYPLIYIHGVHTNFQ